jgi:polysaccharide export outer membrane protein
MRLHLFLSAAFAIASIGAWAQSAAVPAAAVPAAATNVSAAAPAPETSTVPASTPAAGFDQRAPRYELVPGDTLNLHFEFTPELDQQAVPVQPDGFVSLKNLGDVQLSGKTLPEARQVIVQSYAKILREPQITVTLQDFSKPYFVAAGYFNHPGKYDLRGPTTLTEAVAVAGGFRDGAKHSQVWVFHRLRDGTVQSKKVDVKRMMAKANLTEDVSLQPGDTIYVPQGVLSKLEGFVIPRPNISMMPHVP